jgi:uroporphyrin-3 C-methyltransferase
MSETGPEQEAPVPQISAGAAPQPAAAPSRSFTRHLNPVSVIGAIVLILVVWQWLDARHRINALELELGKRLAVYESSGKETRAVAVQTQENTREALVKLGLLEGKIGEFQNQQMALEALYQELSRNRDEWALADIEQVLIIASQQLQLAGNVKAALIAMQTADARLQRLDKLRFVGLRKAINKDIERLKGLPFVDTAGTSVQLDNLMVLVNDLPLTYEHEQRPSKTAEKAKVQNGLWERFGAEIWGEVKQLVQVRRLDKPDMPLLEPSQAYFLRENLKLRLLSARLALLQHDETTYKSDLASAEEWLRTYFNSRDKSTKTAQTILRQLARSPVSIESPDISASLNAVRDYKLSRERN